MGEDTFTIKAEVKRAEGIQKLRWEDRIQRVLDTKDKRREKKKEMDEMGSKQN